jgi:hypothetical protein
MKKQFDYIVDPGHGWVKVPFELLRELGIEKQITSHSYYYQGHVYLEEDCDASRFAGAFASRFGFEPKLRERVARERRSRVRGYMPYHYENVHNVIRLDHNWMQELYDKRKKIVDTQQQA